MIKEYYVIYFRDKSEKRVDLKKGEKLKKALLDGVEWIEIDGSMHRSQFINEVLKHKENILG